MAKDKPKKLGELYTHRGLTHTRSVEHLKDIRPDLYKKHPDGKNPSSIKYWNVIKNMTADEFMFVLDNNESQESIRIFWSERRVTMKVIDRICRDGLYNRRINNDRRFSKNGGK